MTSTQLWRRLRASFWFNPGLIVAASMVAAVGLVEFDAAHSYALALWSPRLFGAGAAGSRAMLSAIATSMVTVAGVVFSITIVALSLTATQYSPRVLRNFMRDTPTQVVLGVFVGIFAYCLVVLRTIRGGDEGAFIPSVAVLGGMAYAFLGIAVLIYFIHHVALAIQSSSILARITADTTRVIDHLFPQELGLPPPASAADVVLPADWTPVAAGRSGYVESIDADALLRAAIDGGRLLRLRRAVGDYVIEGAPLVEAAGSQPLARAAAQRIAGCVGISRQRSLDQDAGFGLQQLGEVAVRALSPGVNDPVTACMCLNELGHLLVRLAGRAMPSPLRFDGGELRVIAPAAEFEALLRGALLPVIVHGRGNAQVLAAAAGTLETIAGAVCMPQRRQVLRELAGEVQAEAARLRPRGRARELRRRLARLRQELASG